MFAVCDAEAVPDGREADPAGGHVRGELLLTEGGAAQQARDRGECYCIACGSSLCEQYVQL